MMDHIQKMLQSLKAQGFAVDDGVALEQLREWSNNGRKIAHLCEALGGPGSLFYLTDLPLSEDL